MLNLLDDPYYPSIDLRRTWWPGSENKEPEVLVGLQWTRGKTLLGPDTTPYIGVRSARETAIAKALREDEEFLRTRRARGHKVSQWWPAYAYVPPSASFPEQSDIYRQNLVDAVLDAWNTYSPLIDRLVLGSAAPTGPDVP